MFPPEGRPLFRTFFSGHQTDSSVVKVLAMQSREPEFEPQNSCENPGMLMCAHNPSTGEVESGRPLVLLTRLSNPINKT